MNITHWNGRHGKGAMRAHREEKRASAQTRKARFDALVEQTINDHEGNITREQAKTILFQQAYTSNPPGEELLREVFTK